MKDSCGIHTTPRAIERYFQLQQFTGGIYKECFGPEVARWYKQRGGCITSAGWERERREGALLYTWHVDSWKKLM